MDKFDKNSTRIPDSNKSPAKPRSRLGHKLLLALQTLSGVVAIFLIPLLWGSWSQTVMLVVLGAILVCAGLFALINYILFRYNMRDDL